MSAGLLLVLALAGAWRAPDLQIEAQTGAGFELPSFADAISRALVARGAQVVLANPATAPCTYCTQVAVTELPRGRCLIEVRQGRHATSTTLHFDGASPLLDRARAVAIHTLSLVTGPAGRHRKPCLARSHRVCY